MSTLAIAVCIYLYWRWRNGISGIGFKDALSFLIPKKVYLHRSAILEYKYLLVDPLVRLLFFSPAMQIPISTYIFAKVQAALVAGMGTPDYHLTYHETYPVLFAIGFTVVLALLKEFGHYFQHLLMHKIPFFWEFHKVHHSAEVLTPASDWRIHPIDLLSMPYFMGIIMGVLQAFLDYFLTSDLSVVSILGVNSILFVYYATFYHFRHSHFKIGFPRFISHFFMSPNQHHIHHSTKHQAL